MYSPLTDNAPSNASVHKITQEDIAHFDTANSFLIPITFKNDVTIQVLVDTGAQTSFINDHTYQLLLTHNAVEHTSLSHSPPLRNYQDRPIKTVSAPVKIHFHYQGQEFAHRFHVTQAQTKALLGRDFLFMNDAAIQFKPDFSMALTFRKTLTSIQDENDDVKEEDDDKEDHNDEEDDDDDEENKHVSEVHLGHSKRFQHKSIQHVLSVSANNELDDSQSNGDEHPTSIDLVQSHTANSSVIYWKPEVQSIPGAHRHSQSNLKPTETRRPPKALTDQDKIKVKMKSQPRQY